MATLLANSKSEKAALAVKVDWRMEGKELEYDMAHAVSNSIQVPGKMNARISLTPKLSSRFLSPRFLCPSLLLSRRP